MEREDRVLHPTLSAGERRDLFRQGIELFNRGEFFASHEAWEEIWRSTTPEPRDLFQGLIQVAAGMHHFLDRHKPGPARRVLAKGRRRLEPFAPRNRGLDVGSLLDSVRRWEEWLGSREGAPPAVPRLTVLAPGEIA